MGLSLIGSDVWLRKSPVGGTDWIGLGGVALLEKVRHWRGKL